MWRRGISTLKFLHGIRNLSSSSSESNKTPTLYSFLQPSIFSLKSEPPHSPPSQPPYNSVASPKSLSEDHKLSLLSTFQSSVSSNNTDEAWKCFKALTTNSAFPDKPLTNSFIAHLSSLPEALNLKRAFASVVYLIEKNPALLNHDTITNLLVSMNINANSASPAFALIKCMFKNRFFVPFSVWGDVIVEISRKGGCLVSFLCVFKENCRISLDEKLEFMKPNLSACVAALDACCRSLQSVKDAENVVELMSVLNVRPDESCFGLLGYLYALKGMDEKIIELEDLMSGFGFSNKSFFLSSLISGYVNSGNLESVSSTILCSLGECNESYPSFGEDIFCEVVKGFLQHGSVKGLASLIIEAQNLESSSVAVERSIGYGIVNACVNLGLLDKAHCILDDMNALGGSVGLGVYVSILKAYCKERRTAEATQLVMDISNSGLNLDAGTYDALIEVAMSSQDFQSAFSLFRDMREARILDLKGSYLTIMTGLTESNRPELMAAFLDEVVEDPRIEVGTHDWNSIIHAFCKAGRIEDARRTLRRMIFLQFKPNDQTYLSLINGFSSAEKYFYVLMLWNDVKKHLSTDGEKGVRFDQTLADAFLYALVKGGFFDAVMQVVDKSCDLKIFVDKWRHKQAFMETHKKLKVAKLRKRNFRKMEALVAFKNWAGLSA